MMEPLRRSSMDKRRHEYFMTRRQRRSIHNLLRDGYDDASRDSRNNPFSVSLFVSDIPNLTLQNQEYLENGQASADMKKLFGIIAARAEFSIDNTDDGYVISLSRGLNHDE